MAGMGLETSTPIGIAGYGCLGLPSASRSKRLEYFSVGGLTSSTSSHDFGHHTLPVGFVRHHMGSSRVILRMTHYGGVRVMVAWHICYAASTFIAAGLKSEWRLGLQPACLTTVAPGVLTGVVIFTYCSAPSG
jgi:hypothetical protein